MSSLLIFVAGRGGIALTILSNPHLFLNLSIHQMDSA